MKKNKGNTIVELIIVMLLIGISSFLSIYAYTKAINKVASSRVKYKIINIVENANTDINFILNENKIKIKNRVINLDDRFIYTTNNISNNFIRKFNGITFDKGFSIFIKDKFNNILEKVVYNTANGLNMPILTTIK